MNPQQINALKELYCQDICGGFLVSEKDEAQISILKKMKVIKEKLVYTCDDCNENFISKAPPTKCIMNESCKSNSFTLCHKAYCPKNNLQSFIINLSGNIKAPKLKIESFGKRFDQIPFDKTSRTDKVYIYISPFFDFEVDFKILRPNYNHVALNWSQINNINKKTVNSILSAVKNEKFNKINWKLISADIFQTEFSRDIARYLGYTKLKDGGTGADQEKDGYAISKNGKKRLFKLKGKLAARTMIQTFKHTFPQLDGIIENICF